MKGSCCLNLLSTHHTRGLLAANPLDFSGRVLMNSCVRKPAFQLKMKGPVVSRDQVSAMLTGRKMP
jgi:hypothetical protein